MLLLCPLAFSFTFGKRIIHVPVGVKLSHADSFPDTPVKTIPLFTCLISHLHFISFHILILKHFLIADAVQSVSSIEVFSSFDTFATSKCQFLKKSKRVLGFFKQFYYHNTKVTIYFSIISDKESALKKKHMIFMQPIRKDASTGKTIGEFYSCVHQSPKLKTW